MELTAAFEFLMKVQNAEEKCVTNDTDIIEHLDNEEIMVEKEEPIDSDPTMDFIIEEPPVAGNVIGNIPTKRRKEAEPEDNEIEFQSRIVIYPQFIVCPVESKQLQEDLASGRISEDFARRPHNLKTLNVTGCMFSPSNPKVLENQLIEDDQDKDDMYLCRYCPKSFSTAHHLMMHTRKVHLCQFCLQGFTKLEDLHVHIEREHTKFECHFCPRAFGNNNNLRMHIKKRHGIQLPAFVSLITAEKEQSQDTETIQES